MEYPKVKRNVLLNPGPATTTDTVKYAQVVPDICPREKEFGDIMKQMGEDLVKIVHGDLNKYTAVLFTGSGTINIDACVNSLVPEGKKILVLNNGAYSARAAEVAEYYHMDHVNLKLPITEPIDMDKDNLDFIMASAQKGLMSMTGLSYVIGNTKMIEASKDYPTRSYYTNLFMQYDFIKNKGEMHFTPPVQTIYATRQAIKEYWEEGEEGKWARHQSVWEALYKGLDRLGFKTIIPRELQSKLVISVLYPNDPNWDFSKVHDYVYERGFTIYPGKVSDLPTFRLCSLGTIVPKDIEDFFECLEAGLKEMNIKVQY